MKIRLNESSLNISEGMTLFALRTNIKPDADVLILNGTEMTKDRLLVDGDRVILITRGEIPSAAEIETLLIARHTPEFHQKLKVATIGIAGLGGLGSSIAIALVRVGIGRLILADFDLVELGNLNRQQYSIDQVGQFKTDALVSTLQKINPYIQINAHTVQLTPKTIFPIFKETDVMIEAFDRADQKAMLLQTFIAARPDTPFIGASGIAGYGSGEKIGIKKMGQNIYIVGDLETSARPHNGLLAPRVGIVAHMQANLAIRILV